MEKRNGWFESSRWISVGTRAAAVFGLLAGITSSARADVESCIDSHASGQREAKAGRLTRASHMFASCGSNTQCPPEIRAECVELFREVERNVPTVLLIATDETGRDVTSVRVYSGDQLLTEHLDGRSVAVDPGEHLFKFVPADGDAVTSNVLVREGEKNRVVSVRVKSHIPAPLQPKPVPVHPAVGPENPSPSSITAGGSPLPAGFWISAGIGTAAIASFSVFGLLGRSHQSTLAECSPDCGPGHQSDFDSMRRDYLIADISLGVAIVSAGAATWFLLSPKHPSRTSGERALTRRVTPMAMQPILWSRGGGLVIRASAF